MSKFEDLPIDRERKLMLLGWLKNGVINGEQLSMLQGESQGHKFMSMEEARALLREIEESY